MRGKKVQETNSNQENDKHFVLVSNLEKEIDDLETQIAKFKKGDKGRKRIRNLRLFWNFIRLILPYVVTASIIITGWWLVTGDIPWILQKESHYNYHSGSMDNSGYNMPVNDYIPKKNLDSDEIYSYTAWEKGTDGKYYRDAKKYYVNRDKKIYTNFDELKALMTNPDLNLDEIFEKPYASLTECKETVTKEELKRGAYTVVNYGYFDYDDSIIARQQMGDNIGMGLLCCMIAFMGGMIVWAWREDHSTFDYSYNNRSIISDCKNANCEALEEKLEEKQKELRKLNKQ